jgi:hypothetical protein
MWAILALVPIEIAFLWYTLKRSGFVPFPHLSLIYMIGCQISVWLVTYKIAEYRFLQTYSTYGFSKHFVALESFFAAIFFFSFFVFMPRRHMQFGARLRSSIRIPITEFGVWMFVLTLWMFHIVLAAVLNWRLVWLNETYLLMNDQRVLSAVNPGSRFLVTVLPLVGFAVFALVSVYAGRKYQYVAAALMPLAIFDYAYELGAHSRKAVMYLVVFTAISIVLNRSKKILVFAVPLIFFSLAFCLGGRVYGEHGISTIFEAGSILSRYSHYDASLGFLNLFEGSFVSGELFGSSHHASTLYKILSFSPFPSFIDGFHQILGSNIHKLGPYAPPSAILEAWWFGPPYIILLLLPQVIAGRMVVRLMERGNSTVVIAANLLMAFASYLQFTYPVRTVYRFFLIALFLAVLGALAERIHRNSHRRRSAERNSERGLSPHDPAAAQPVAVTP